MTDIVHQRVVRFGAFEADLRTQELRKHGLRIKLPRQSFQVLEMLLDRPGELVSREELQKALWPADTFVDFENGLNNAVKRIRGALGDSADSPRFVETLPRLGYRFISTIDPQSKSSPSESAQISQIEPQSGSNGGTHGDRPPGLRDTAGEPGTNGNSSDSLSSFASKTHRNSSSRLLRKIGLIAFAALALGGIAFTLWRAGRSSALPTLTIVPLTSYPGLEVGPTFSPDGTKVAFAWTGGEERDDNFDLYVKVIGTETPVQLTHTPSLGLYPSWSPDGRFIAFARLTLGDNRDDAGLFLIPAVGGPERKLTDLVIGHYIYQGAITWSPDGKFLLYAGPSENERTRSHVSLLNVETLETKRLPDPSENCQFITFPVLSPDGRTLAEACQLSFGLSSIYVTPFPNGKSRLLIQNKGDLGGLTWSKDGRCLIYALNGELWRIAASGGTPERLWFAQDAQGPVISPTGNRLAYMRSVFFSDLWSLPIDREMRTTGSPTRFVAANVEQKNPQFSPDGTRVAFESVRSGSTEIWTSDAEGKNLQQLTNFRGPLTGTPRWSPDGKQIAFDSRASGRPEVYVIGADGGSPRMLPTTPDGGSVPYWSHDGRWIYFVGGSTSNSQLYKVRPEGGKPVQLTRTGGFISMESPDGKRLFYTSVGERVTIWSVSVDGEDEHRVAGIPDLGWPAFTITSQGILYYDTLEANPTLHLYDFATGQLRNGSRVPGRPTSFNAGITISPDGRSLLFPQISEETSDLILVEGFQ